MLHHDNASSHSPWVTETYLMDNHIKIVPHPLIPLRWLAVTSGYFPGLKRSLRGRHFRSEEELNSAVMAYFDGIPPEKWLEVFRMWQNFNIFFCELIKCKQIFLIINIFDQTTGGPKNKKFRIILVYSMGFVS